MYQKTAILYFARSAGEESRHRQVRQARDLYGVLDTHTQNLLHRLDLPVYRSTEKDQAAGSFGEKLARAVLRIFQQGYSQLLVLGNDCPDLQAAHLRKALTCLQQGKQVLGPARDGGCYLLGLQAAAFDPQEFATLPWQSARLSKALQLHLHHPACLQMLSDLDSEAQLRAYFAHGKNTLLRRKLQQLFGEYAPVVPCTPQCYLPVTITRERFARGSPVAAY